MKRDLARVGRDAMKVIRHLTQGLDSENDDTRGKAIESISDDPLLVEVRDGWRSPGDRSESCPVEYRILLSCGGPSVRIVGELSSECEPLTSVLEVQDWFVNWEPYRATTPLARERNDAALMRYVQCFFYGESV